MSEREAFEAWARSIGKTDRDLQKSGYHGYGQYIWGTEQQMFEAWNARAAIEAQRVPDGWQPIGTAPENMAEMVIVYWIDREGEKHHDFDYTEDGCWMQWHSHAEHVEIIGGNGVSYTPPYTHWMPLPAAPGASAPPVAQPSCPYCSSDNKAVREAYFDQTCPGCVARMAQPAVSEKVAFCHANDSAPMTLRDAKQERVTKEMWRAVAESQAELLRMQNGQAKPEQAQPAERKPLEISEDDAFNLAKYVYARSQPYDAPQILLTGKELKAIIEAAANGIGD
jgi:hypothetical protein